MDDTARIDWKGNAPFIILQLLPLGIIWTGMHLRDLVLCITLYYFRMFFVSAGLHRYFSHKSYKMGRTMQFLMGLGTTLSLQSGWMQWVANHRGHHKYSDTPKDPHSARPGSHPTNWSGFWWAHWGWILCGRSEPMDDIRKEYANYPELLFLQRFERWPPILFGGLILWIFGWSGFFGGLCLSTLLLYHGTFSINSLNHKFGSRRYETGDDSTNSFWLAIVSMGEGWHNNHHHYQSATAQGFYWWEIDPSYYILKGFEKLGLVRDLRRPTTQALTDKLLSDAA